MSNAQNDNLVANNVEVERIAMADQRRSTDALPFCDPLRLHIFRAFWTLARYFDEDVFELGKSQLRESDFRLPRNLASKASTASSFAIAPRRRPSLVYGA